MCKPAQSAQVAVALFATCTCMSQFLTVKGQVDLNFQFRRQIFRLVQIETNSRQHFKMHLKWKISAI